MEQLFYRFLLALALILAVACIIVCGPFVLLLVAVEGLMKWLSKRAGMDV